jgi:hypothetical protein
MSGIALHAPLTAVLKNAAGAIRFAYKLRASDGLWFVNEETGTATGRAGQDMFIQQSLLELAMCN